MTEFRTLLSNFVKKSQTNGLLKNDGTVDTTSYISTSNTQGLLKNDGTVDTTNYLSTHQDITGKEDKSNKVTSLSSSSTDTQYPSAKCIYDNFIFNENLTPYTHILSNYTNTSSATLSVANEVLTITGNGASNGDTGLSNTKVFAPKDEDYIISFDIRKTTGTYAGKDFNMVIGDSNHYLNISPQYYVIRFVENGTEFNTIDAISCTDYTNIKIQRINGNNWKFYVDDVLKHSFTTNSSEIPNQITFYGFHDSDVVDVKNVKITRKRIDSSNELVDMIYPVGSIYMSVNNVNPQYLFGGTWEQIEDRFLLASGSTYSAGSTGGSANAVVVSHNHTQASHTHTTTRNYVGINGNCNWAYASTRQAASSGSTYFPYSDKNTDGITEPNTMTTVTPTINSQGESGTGKNMPPYLTVYMWKRTA